MSSAPKRPSRCTFEPPRGHGKGPRVVKSRSQQVSWCEKGERSQLHLERLHNINFRGSLTLSWSPWTKRGRSARSAVEGLDSGPMIGVDGVRGRRAPRPSMNRTAAMAPIAVATPCLRKFVRRGAVCCVRTCMYALGRRLNVFYSLSKTAVDTFHAHTQPLCPSGLPCPFSCTLSRNVLHTCRCRRSHRRALRLADRNRLLLAAKG